MVLTRALTCAATAALLLLASAGCLTARDRLTSAADHLEHHAIVMAENARYQPPGVPYPPNYGQDALILANDASRLSDAAHEHASEQEVTTAYARVSRDYDAVRDAVAHAPNPQAATDLVPITAAYGDLRRSVGKPLNQAADRVRQKAAEAL